MTPVGTATPSHPTGPTITASFAAALHQRTTAQVETLTRRAALENREPLPTLTSAERAKVDFGEVRRRVEAMEARAWGIPGHALYRSESEANAGGERALSVEGERAAMADLGIGDGKAGLGRGKGV